MGGGGVCYNYILHEQQKTGHYLFSVIWREKPVKLSMERLLLYMSESGWIGPVVGASFSSGHNCGGRGASFLSCQANKVGPSTIG